MTIGIVLAAAFFYPLLPGRRGRGSMWELAGQSPEAFRVLITGGSCGLILVVVGIVLVNWRAGQRPAGLKDSL